MDKEMRSFFRKPKAFLVIFVATLFAMSVLDFFLWENALFINTYGTFAAFINWAFFMNIERPSRYIIFENSLGEDALRVSVAILLFMHAFFSVTFVLIMRKILTKLKKAD